MAKTSAAKILKDKGLIPKNWDLRKPLTRGQKSYVTKQANTYKALLNRPGDFSPRIVGKATAEKLKSAGYLTKGRKVFVSTRGIHGLHISKGSLYIRSEGQTERIVLDTGESFLTRLQSLESAKPLRRNQYYGIKIGDTRIVQTISPDLEELQRYMSRMTINSPSALNHMRLVIITDTDGWFEDRDD